jgi:hypothetical protein
LHYGVSRVWLILEILMPFLAVFVTWLTGFLQTYPPSSWPYGLPFPWKWITYAYSNPCSPLGNVDVCRLLGFSLGTVIDWNAFAIDATLFSAAGYAVLIGSYAVIMSLSDRTPLFFGRIGSMFYYTLIPVFAVFVTLMTGSWGGEFQVWQGFPFGWRSTCPGGLLIACGLTSYAWLSFALDALVYSATWYGFQLAYSRLLARRGTCYPPRTAPPK